MSDELKGPKVGYHELLDHHTIKVEEEKQKDPPRNPLRPSSSGKCSRALALELEMYRGKAKYEKPIMDPNIVRLLDLGHSVEYHALRQFKKISGLEQKYKQQMLSFFPIQRGSPDLPEELLEGSCDFVLWSDKYKAIGDVKSKKDGWSAAYKSKWDENLAKYSRMNSVTPFGEDGSAFWIPDLPKFLDELGEDFLSDNFLQLNLYAHSKFIQDRNIDHCVLYYYNKNDSRHFEMRFNPSTELYEQVKDKFNRVSVMVDEDKVPETCDFTPGSMKYAFCDCHKMKPYDNEDPLKQWFRTLPKKVWPKDTDKLKNTAKLDKMLTEFKEMEDLELKREVLERKIVKELLAQKVKKVKTKSGDIYELKFLKSPREHYELRKGKL